MKNNFSVLKYECIVFQIGLFLCSFFILWDLVGIYLLFPLKYACEILYYYTVYLLLIFILELNLELHLI